MDEAVIKTYKYRIKDRHAKRPLVQHAYACNQVWNWCVAQHRDAARNILALGRGVAPHVDESRRAA